MTERWRMSAARRLNRDQVVEISTIQQVFERWSLGESLVCEGERILYSIRSLTFSQWEYLRIWVVWENLGALTTARTRESVKLCLIVTKLTNSCNPNGCMLYSGCIVYSMATLVVFVFTIYIFNNLLLNCIVITVFLFTLFCFRLLSLYVVWHNPVYIVSRVLASASSVQM